MRPGIVDARDLASRIAWMPLEITRFIAAAGLAPEDGAIARRFSAPRVVVLIVPDLQPALVLRSRGWLADAAHVIVVRDRTAGNELGGDAEVLALHEQEWTDAVAQLPSRDVLVWTGDPTICGDAIARAVAANAPFVAEDSSEPQPAAHWHELPASPWIELGTEGIYRPSSIPNQLVVDRTRACLRLDATQTIDLAAPPMALQLFADDNQPPPGYVPLGRDPDHPVGWRGHRMTHYWYWNGREPGFLSASDHDWPCGPAKKRFGFQDNDPVQILLAPAADAYVARFEHDILLTTAVPIPWQRAGDVDIATWVRDKRRAVFFVHDAGVPDMHDPDADLLDDDARDVAPVLVLGPDAACRYALDLHHRVHRITNPTASTDQDVEQIHVGGPRDGFIVCDADHAVVRRGSGRLLGGWFRHATIEHEGQYWREDLATGARVRLGPVDLAVCDDPEFEAIARDATREGRHDVAAEIHASHPAHAVDGDDDPLAVYAIPGTVNVVIVGKRYLRIV